MLASLASMIPDPLHPAIVHLPMALAVLAPLFAVGAVIVARRSMVPRKIWSVAVAVLLALSASAWASSETGEDQENRVERVVPKAALDGHEDAADNFLWLSVGVLVVASAGLLPGRIAAPARLVATAGSVLLLVAGYRVGHTGGELVYTHGAASAYVKTAGSGAGVVGPAPLTSQRSDDDD